MPLTEWKPAGPPYRRQLTSKARNPAARARDEPRRAEPRSRVAADKRHPPGGGAVRSATLPDRVVEQRSPTAAKRRPSVEVPTTWFAFRSLPDASNGDWAPRLRCELKKEPRDHHTESNRCHSTRSVAGSPTSKTGLGVGRAASERTAPLPAQASRGAARVKILISPYFAWRLSYFRPVAKSLPSVTV
jgi:hypothetical protein